MECIDSKMRVRDQRGPQSWCAVFGFSCPDYCLPIEVLDNLSFLVSDLSDLSDLTVLRVPPSASDQAWAISNQLNMCSVPQSVPGLCVSTPPPHTHTKPSCLLSNLQSAFLQIPQSKEMLHVLQQWGWGDWNLKVTLMFVAMTLRPEVKCQEGCAPLIP